MRFMIRQVTSKFNYKTLHKSLHIQGGSKKVYDVIYGKGFEKF